PSPCCSSPPCSPSSAPSFCSCAKCTSPSRPCTSRSHSGIGDDSRRSKRQSLPRTLIRARPCRRFRLRRWPSGRFAVGVVGEALLAAPAPALIIIVTASGSGIAELLPPGMHELDASAAGRRRERDLDALRLFRRHPDLPAEGEPARRLPLLDDAPYPLGAVLAALEQAPADPALHGAALRVVADMVGRQRPPGAHLL